MNTLRPLTIILLAFLILISSAAAVRAEWKAGAARINITPQKPLWMAGYASRDHAAEGKLNDLWARALVLEDGQGQRAVGKPWKIRIYSAFPSSHHAAFFSSSEAGVSSNFTLMTLTFRSGGDLGNPLRTSRPLCSWRTLTLSPVANSRADLALVFTSGTTASLPGHRKMCR